jgi:voltage-gated potassium channel Kch
MSLNYDTLHRMLLYRLSSALTVLVAGITYLLSDEQASQKPLSKHLLTLVVITGSVMYIIEGKENGFTSIPYSVYWAVVTLTTVGYGDISSGKCPGQFLAAIVMILGYSIIAVPTGIVTVKLSQAYTNKSTSQKYRILQVLRNKTIVLKYML